MRNKKITGLGLTGLFSALLFFRLPAYALEYGPLLYAAMGAPNPVRVSWDPARPEKWFRAASNGKLQLLGDSMHEYWPYCDIHDEPFSVYPIVTMPKE